MDSRRPDHSWGPLLLVLGVVLCLALAGSAGTVRPGGRQGHPHTEKILSDLAGSFLRLFSREYPANQAFRSELKTLRATGKLKAGNEALIERTALGVSSKLKMPPALLWCLLFQESRLNHLAGLGRGKAATGLGQFAFFSFYEVNFHLDRYGLANREMMVDTLGSDVRPVGAFRRDLFNPSSYYYIPTAVVATAAYLNNRHEQLRHALERRKIPYDSGLLWLFAVMAYNKGSRAVMALWNEVQSAPDRHDLRRIVSDRPFFFRSLRDSGLYERALEAIWPREQALAYASELEIHMAKMRDCAIADEDQLKFHAPAAGKEEELTQ